MRRIISLLLTMALLLSSMGTYSHAGDYADKLYLKYNENIYRYNGRLVTVEIDEQIIETGDMPAVIIDGRTLVPVREVFESEGIGAKVDWNGDLQQVSISYADRLIILQIDNRVAYVNGVAVELDVPPMLIQDINKDYAKTMIPLRFVSESLDFKVDWDGDTYTAMLDSGKVVDVRPTEKPEEETKPSLEEPSEKSNTDIVAGEKLDGLTGEGANKELPTLLKDNPVHWSATAEQLAELDEIYVETSITNEEHSETQIKDVDYDDSGAFKQFVVKASSAMSVVKHFVWNGKFVIDISNSVNKLENEEPFEDNPVLTSIRASQYSVSPNATRIVFDLIDGGNKFDLSFNEDRSKLIIRVTDNSIHDIYLGQNENGDYIQVTGVAAPDVKMFRLSQPDRIVIDFPNTQSLLGFNESEAEGQYVEKLRTAQFDLTTTRIVVETDGQADYQITKAAGGQTVIQFTEPGYKNIEYENVDKPTIALDQDEADIDVAGIVYKNDYMNRKFHIMLSENYGAMFGEGSLKVNDGIIETVDVVETADGKTEIIIESTTVHEYRIEEVDNKVFIKAYKPKELYSQVVVVDAGHGGKDPGASEPHGSGDKDWLVEKTLNLTITRYLKELLDGNDSLQVYYTRLDDSYPTLQERCDLANEVEADMFLSIHNNAYNSSHMGTETLYFPSQATGILTSPSLARIFQDTLVAKLGSNDRGIKQRETLFVLHHTAMPAVIAEIGFLTNINDAANLKKDDYLRLVAEGLHEATNKVFEDYPTRR